MNKSCDENFDLAGFLPYQLTVIASRISRAFSDVYAQEAGLSMPEWRILAHIRNERAVSVREIHQRTDLDKSKVSRATDRLEQAGLLIKTINPLDRRLVELSLTDKGNTLMDRLIPLANRFQADLLDNLGDEGLVFVATMKRLLDMP